MLRTLSFAAVLASGPSLFAQSVNATVVPPAGGAPVAVTIGKLDIKPGPNGKMVVDFTFAGPSPGTGFPGGFGFLDNWYDFRWINIVTGYKNAAGVQVTNAANQPIAPGLGRVPAMDPQPLANNGDDDLPFYYTDVEWNGGLFLGQTINPNDPNAPAGTPPSRFADQRMNHPAGTTIEFECYLVARSITDPLIAPNEIVVLDGFKWTHSSGTGLGGTNVAAFGGVLAANPGRVNTALGLADGGAGFPAVPGSGAWTALGSGNTATTRKLQGCVPPLAWWQYFGFSCDPLETLRLWLDSAPVIGSVVNIVTSGQSPNPSVGLTLLSPGVIPNGMPLSFVGAPNCMLYVDVATAVSFPLLSTHTSVALPIPIAPSLVGATLYGQNFWYDPSANPFGFVSSNGISLTVGF